MLLTFYFFAVVAVLSSLGVLVCRSPVYSAMSLVCTFFCLGAIYVLLNAEFVAVIQILVYAGAILVLFLFVIMLIGVDKSETREETLPYQRTIVGGIAAAVIILAGGITVFGDFVWVPAATGTNPEATSGTVEAIAEPMFTDWVLAFEATALLLTIAAAGAVALAHYRRRQP